ncbi:signal transduction protein [Methanoculleus taiwanensis]|uniref:Signal transduction protein n=1 Tax=Methanoculleus taiwanensis TaxID=1550565 RepID=A0A498H2T6_9EURY|nr:CBS domain-containing protein [Methanoculleus taiwanensis]RXE56296.1 signal transduction protein [Methanoculleus taiwanensis]
MDPMKYLREDVVSVSPDTSGVDVAKIMEQKNVGSVVVVDGDGRPTGIITDRDMIVRVVARDKRPEEMKARDIMTRNPTAFTEGMQVTDAMERMMKEGIRRMPIVDRNGRLTGIVIPDDIIRLLGDEISYITRNIEKQSLPGSPFYPYPIV